MFLVGGQFLSKQQMAGDGRRPDAVRLDKIYPMRRVVLACLLSASDAMDVRAELIFAPLLVNFKLF